MILILETKSPLPPEADGDLGVVKKGHRTTSSNCTPFKIL